MTQALIAFGANQGDVQSSFEEARNLIAADASIELIAVAEPLVTTAVSGEAGQANVSADYINSVFLIETPISAEELFLITSGIENKLGRQRARRWGPRTIDLDIILFGQEIIDRAGLQVPHRRMSFRKFVIDPAVDIAAEMVDPVSGVSLKALSQRLQRSDCRILWVADDTAAAEKLVQSSLSDCTGSGWEFEIVVGFDAVEDPLENYRLLVCSNPKVSWLGAARIFAGPWMSLVDVTPEGSIIEIRGAIQAMQ